MKRYLRVNVLTDNSIGNCSNNGVSVTHANKLVVEHPRGNYTAEEVEEFGYIILELIKRNIGGKSYMHLRPTSLPATRWVMMGGCYISTCDSRFSDISQYPLPLHDRVE